MDRAHEVMRLWKNDYWFYCGVVVSIECDEIILTGHPAPRASLWGIECNYPSFNKRVCHNGYLRDVANEILPEVLAEAKQIMEKLAVIAA